MDLYTVLVELTSEYEFFIPAKTKSEAVKLAKLIYGSEAIKPSKIWRLDPDMSDTASEYKALKEKK